MAEAAATATEARPRTRTRRKALKTDQRTPWWMWIAVLAILIFCLFPFYWLVNMSLKTGNDLQSSRIFPAHASLANYRAIFRNSDFTHALRNSAVVALTTTVLALIVGSFCAYALARLKLKGKILIL